MLLQKILRNSWQGHITSPPRCYSRFLLHHTRPRPDVHLRAFRGNAKHRANMKASPIPTPLEAYVPPPGSPGLGLRNVARALLFTGTFTLGCFAGAAILEYENTRQMILKKVFWTRRQAEEPGRWQKVKWEVKTLWDQLTPGEKVFAPICALNVIVFGMWRLPSMRNVMMKYFCSNPAAHNVCWPMFLSTFSHYSLFHLFANMYVLHSFSNAAVLSMGREQFLAVYLSGGVISSFVSILYKTITAQAGLSIGASGAIMAILAYVCTQYPDTELSVLFLPMFSFSAGSAIKVIMGIDLAGCIMGWKFFDHAAHLGGALFGMGWAVFGSELWRQRLPVLSWYHDLRKKK